jgi:predicted nuclease of predicted toxin-antitoxin system
MNIVLDENVSLGLADVLRGKNHSVTAIAEIAERGMNDEEVFIIAKRSSAVLITRDYHFTNPSRFSPSEIGAIIYIRIGNLSSQEEISLVEKFLSRYALEDFQHKLVTLSRHNTKIR